MNLLYAFLYTDSSAYELIINYTGQQRHLYGQQSHEIIDYEN